MSIARPSVLFRRAVALPKGLLDRVEAGLDAAVDAGFTRVDGAIDHQISAVSHRCNSLSSGLSQSANFLDRALDQQVTKLDSRAQTRAAKTKAKTERIGSGVRKIETRADSKLDRSLHAADRATAVGNSALIVAINASVALTHRAENKISRGFNRVDVRATNVANRAHSRRIKTANLAVRATAQIDQRIETDFLRADVRVNAGIDHTVNTIESTLARTVAVTKATETRLSNAITHIDARIDARIASGASAAAATRNLVNAKSLAFERALDLGITRVDARIKNSQTRVIAKSVALVNAINSTDQGLSRVVIRVDSRVDKRIAQVTYGYVVVTDFAGTRVAIADTKLENSVTNFDARVATGVSALVAAATGISNFVTDHVDDVDTALTNRMSRMDARADSILDLMNGQPGRHVSQPRTSLPWAATSLTLVLGTLGAATGASVVNASSLTSELDTTVKIETSAAKDAVSQYLSVRDSFQAAQASRSRNIQTLEQEIAAAQARISNNGLDGAAIIDVADDLGGVPYIRGGTTPKGFDCSGYTSYVFGQLGVSLPRTSESQAAWADPVSIGDRQPGDLVFWANGGRVHHVAIYAGGGLIWDSPRPGRRVGKVGIWGNPFYGRVPIEAVNASAIKEVEAMTVVLEEIKAQVPGLEITIDPANLLPATD